MMDKRKCDQLNYEYGVFTIHPVGPAMGRSVAKRLRRCRPDIIGDVRDVPFVSVAIGYRGSRLRQ